MHTESNVREALGSGHSARRAQPASSGAAAGVAGGGAAEAGSAVAPWDHSTIAIASLEDALKQLTDFPSMSDVGKGLAVEGSLVLAIRQALIRCDWAQVSRAKSSTLLLLDSTRLGSASSCLESTAP